MSSSDQKCDVFLSFRGKDTRYDFTKNLYKALCDQDINTFIDDKLKKGSKISTLMKEIKKAKVSVIIFSINYASSSWCLDELVKIMKRKEKLRQFVIPVFYGVDPSDVYQQKGSFTITSQGFEGRSLEEIQTWRTALKKVENIPGWDIRHSESESKLIEEVVKDVAGKLAAWSIGGFLGAGYREGAATGFEAAAVYSKTVAAFGSISFKPAAYAAAYLVGAATSTVASTTSTGARPPAAT